MGRKGYGRVEPVLFLFAAYVTYHISRSTYVMECLPTHEIRTAY